MKSNIQQSYREAAVRGANPVALVARLYEQVIEDMRHVAIAIEQNDISQRTSRIKHALLVIGYLQSTLDFVQGGKVAKDLDDFYNALRQNVVWVQFHPSKRAATQVITDLLAVREAWVQVEQTEHPSVAIATRVFSSSGSSSSAADSRLATVSSDAAMDAPAHAAGKKLDWNG
jgi:flagellar biosynthetic protein FliS